MTIIADASVVIAALVDSGPDGTWADQLLRSDHLGAPHLMPAEVANLLRRAVLAGKISVRAIRPAGVGSPNHRHRLRRMVRGRGRGVGSPAGHVGREAFSREGTALQVRDASVNCGSEFVFQP